VLATVARTVCARFKYRIGTKQSAPSRHLEQNHGYALNGSGIRATARVLGISPQTVRGALQKRLKA